MVKKTKTKKTQIWKKKLSSSKTGESVGNAKQTISSSPEPLGSQGELIVYPSSWRPSVRP